MCLSRVVYHQRPVESCPVDHVVLLLEPRTLCAPVEAARACFTTSSHSSLPFEKVLGLAGKATTLLVTTNISLCSFTLFLPGSPPQHSNPS